MKYFLYQKLSCYIIYAIFVAVNMYLKILYLFLLLDPMKRATIEDIRKHEWFMKVRKSLDNPLNI